MRTLTAEDIADDGVRRTIAESSLIAAKVFEAMQWTYGMLRRDGPVVPDVERIAQTFTELAEGLVQHECRNISSGRLMVEASHGGDSIDLYVHVGDAIRNEDGTWLCNIDKTVGGLAR